MSWYQQEITLAPRPRGMHLITSDITGQLPALRSFRIGLAHLFLRHTSASLTLNENADPDVRGDLDRALAELVPDGAPYFRHRSEGPDDMSAHVKTSLLGVSLTLPLRDGSFALGTWQGVYLCEHREHGGARRLVVTLHGERDTGEGAGR